MTSLTVLFALVALLVAGAILLSLSVLLRRDVPASRLFLGILLLGLAALVWAVGIQNPLPLP